jgi:hypothetical protein
MEKPETLAFKSSIQSRALLHYVQQRGRLSGDVSNFQDSPSNLVVQRPFRVLTRFGRTVSQLVTGGVSAAGSSCRLVRWWPSTVTVQQLRLPPMAQG